MFDQKRKEEDESVTEEDSHIEETCFIYLFIYFEGIGVRGRVFRIKTVLCPHCVSATDSC